MIQVPVIVAIAIAIAMASAQASAQTALQCGELKNHFGPFDYRSRAQAANLELVEQHHFNTEVELLIRGVTGPIGGDLAYTLYVFPNHTRALAAIARLSLKNKSTHVEGTKLPVECFFIRAVRFKPDDAGVRSLYGSYLYKLGRTDEAFALFSEAVRLAPDSGSMNYNLALAYFEKKDYDNAVLFAKKAYAAGYPLPGLKNKLTAMGKWNVSTAD